MDKAQGPDQTAVTLLVNGMASGSFTLPAGMMFSNRRFRGRIAETITLEPGGRTTVRCFSDRTRYSLIMSDEDWWQL